MAKYSPQPLIRRSDDTAIWYPAGTYSDRERILSSVNCAVHSARMSLKKTPHIKRIVISFYNYLGTVEDLEYTQQELGAIELRLSETDKKEDVWQMVFIAEDPQ